MRGRSNWRRPTELNWSGCNALRRVAEPGERRPIRVQALAGPRTGHEIRVTWVNAPRGRRVSRISGNVHYRVSGPKELGGAGPVLGLGEDGHLRATAEDRQVQVVEGDHGLVKGAGVPS